MGGVESIYYAEKRIFEESGIIYYIGFMYFRPSSFNGGGRILNKFGGFKGGRSPPLSNKQSHSIVESTFYAEKRLF